ncbi:unnamed protein product, partial [Vitis vinifera]
METRRVMQIFQESMLKLWNEWEVVRQLYLASSYKLSSSTLASDESTQLNPGSESLFGLILVSRLGGNCFTGYPLRQPRRFRDQGDSKGKLLDPNYTLMAFWAPFLLLHLGGPDTVTAYSIEENELWLRHSLGLVIQAGVAFYVFLRSWAGTPLTFLSIPMFVAGIIKYGERTWVLRFASKNHFRDSLLPGPDYADFLKGCSSRKDERQVNRITKVEIEIPVLFYKFIILFFIFGSNIFECLVVFSLIFLQRTGARAMQIFPESMRKLWNEWELRLMVLLSLFLQIVLIIFSNRRKYTVTPWIRILIWSAYLSADWVATVSLGTLSNSQGDSEGKLLDPNYTLMAFWAPFLLLHLGGPDTITAYSLEDNELWLRHLLGLVVQVGYGERTWVLRSASKNHFRDSLLLTGENPLQSTNQFKHLYADLILSLDDQKTSEGIIRYMSSEDAFKVVEMELNFMYDVLYTKATVIYSLLGILLLITSDKRWSRRMAQNNLIDSCLRDKTKFNQVPRFLDMNNFLERYWYMTWEKVDDMKEPIFSLLLEMTNDVRDLRSLLKHRGDYVITKRRVIETLGWSIVDVKFDHSILLWHIATDLCSYSDDDPNPKSRCKISKCLSEYMLYLLVMCPFMLPKGIGEFRFRDTCSETKRFFQQRSESISNRNEACRLLLEVDTEVEPKEVKGDKSKSVLFEACRLAKELAKILESPEMAGTEEKWEMISHVWMEMLFYAATHCE